MHAFLASVLPLLFLLAPGGGWLGVYLAADQEHAVVAEVIPGSPAQKAGLRAGDVILAAGDTKTPTADALVKAIGAASPGEKVALTILREGKQFVTAVKLGKRPPENALVETARPAPAKDPHAKGQPAGEAKPAQPRQAKGQDVVQGPKPYLGISVVEEEKGVGIERILDGSPAAASPLRAGDVIKTVGDRRIKDLDDLDAALEGMKVGKALQIGVQRGDSRFLISVTPGQRGKPVKAPAKVVFKGGDVPPVRVKAKDAPKSEKVVARPRAVAVPHAQVKQPAKQAVEQELKKLRAELQELRKELRELKKQLQRERR